MRHDPEVQRVVSTYQLGLPRMPIAGRSGEMLGRGSGSSLEFQEFREYVPGDDIRHLDWAAYARTDALMVRLYREEISPRTEIVLDASRSMTTGEGVKERVAKQLATVFAQLCGYLGGRPSLILVNDARPITPIGMDMIDSLESIPFDGVGSLTDSLAESALPLKPQAVRIVLSDFLFPHDPDSLLRRLAAGAGVLWVVQLLTRWELDPEEMGGRRLIDIEGGAHTDLIINRRAITAYRERLTRLTEGLTRSCRRVHAAYVRLDVNRGLEALCRDELCAAEMLRIA